MSKFRIVKVPGSLFPWRLYTPSGIWIDSPSWAHAVADFQHIAQLYRQHARRRTQ